MKEDKLKEEFLKMESQLRSYGEYVREKIENELERKMPNIDLRYFFKVRPDCRVKTVESFIEKALYRGKNYQNPINDITDKVGLRFIVMSSKDVKLIGSIIESIRDWSFSKDRDFKEEREKEPLIFDYQSDHYILKIDNSTTHKGKEISAGMSCEVQVRTLMQHAFAEISHKVGYKPRFISSMKNKRLLSRSVAIIETVDDNFDRVLSSYTDTFEKIDKSMEVVATSYRDLGFANFKFGKLDENVFESYVEAFDEDFQTEFVKYIKEKQNIKEWIDNKKKDNVLYSQPSILLLYYLASNKPNMLVKDSPFDTNFLKPIFNDLGISSDSYI